MDGSEEPKLYPECYELACRIINGLDYHEYVEECKRMRSAPGVNIFNSHNLTEIEMIFMSLNFCTGNDRH